MKILIIEYIFFIDINIDDFMKQNIKVELFDF